jgi:hypothetical protein
VWGSVVGLCCALRDARAEAEVGAGDEGATEGGVGGDPATGAEVLART